MQAGGSEMMSGTNLEDIIALCRCAVKTSGLWDPMIKWLVEVSRILQWFVHFPKRCCLENVLVSGVCTILQILEKTGAASTLQTVLEDYQQQNPSHPMAHKYLLEHYLKHHPNDIALRLPILHVSRSTARLLARCTKTSTRVHESIVWHSSRASDSILTSNFDFHE